MIVILVSMKTSDCSDECSGEILQTLIRGEVYIRIVRASHTRLSLQPSLVAGAIAAISLKTDPSEPEMHDCDEDTPFKWKLVENFVGVASFLISGSKCRIYPR